MFLPFEAWLRCHLGKLALTLHLLPKLEVTSLSYILGLVSLRVQYSPVGLSTNSKHEAKYSVYLKIDLFFKLANITSQRLHVDHLLRVQT